MSIQFKFDAKPPRRGNKLTHSSSPNNVVENPNKIYNRIDTIPYQYVAQKDIIASMVFKDDMNLDITNDIINDMDAMISKEMETENDVQIPYMGTVSKSAVKKHFRERRRSHSILKKQLSKEDYDAVIYDEINEIKNDIKIKKAREEIVRSIRRKNSKRYNYLARTQGKAYADMFIWTKLNVRPVPFDEHLNNLILGIEDD